MRDYTKNASVQYACKTPQKIRCVQTRGIFFTKEQIIAEENKYHFERDNRENHFTEKKVIARKCVYRPRLWLLVFIVILFWSGSILYGFTVANSKAEKIEGITKESCVMDYDETQVIAEQDSGIESAYDNSFETTGMVIQNSQEEILDFIKTNITIDGRVFPNSSSELVTEEELNELENLYEESVYKLILRAGVNEIYAKYNYKFSKNMWFSYFNTFEWYQPDENVYVDFDSFNPIEITNINAFQREERKFL